MKPICNDLQERLAVEGAAALRSDPAAQRHLEECADCFRVLEQLARLDAAFAAIPAHDATDRVVADLLDRVKADSVPAAVVPFAPPRPTRRTWLWALATAASVGFVALFVTPSLMRARVAAPSRAIDAVAVPSAKQPRPPATTAPEPQKKGDRDDVGRFRQEGEPMLRYPSEDKRVASPAPPAVQAPAAPKLEERYEVRSNEKRGQAGGRGDELDSRRGTLAQTGKQLGDRPEGQAGGVPGDVVGGLSGGQLALDGPVAVRVGGTVAAPRRIRDVQPVYPVGARSARVQGEVLVEIVIDAAGKVQSARVLRSVPLLDAATLDAVKQWVYAPTLIGGRPVRVVMTVPVEFRLSASPSPDTVREFFDERASTEAAFQPASGYWANTYLPGDPMLRLLRARLQG